MGKRNFSHKYQNESEIPEQGELNLIPNRVKSFWCSRDNLHFLLNSENLDKCWVLKKVEIPIDPNHLDALEFVVTLTYHVSTGGQKITWKHIDHFTQEA